MSTYTALPSLRPLLLILLVCQATYAMSIEEKRTLKEKAKEMFLHGYNSYMENAFPADELMPLSCKGRYRHPHLSRGDIDDALGNFSLTLIDSLDTLFMLNQLDEFENAVLKVVTHVSLESDVDVSVFEVNIRVLGGLLGGHVSALAIIAANNSRMSWYHNELLEMAADLGNRLLPAFNTSTGIPYPRVNLFRATRQNIRFESDTCTACAGTMILEFAALSRLTGNPIYEEKAARAMAVLWQQRNRYSDLVGTVINVHNGAWVHRESGVGAGIDSYYEYLLKAYILLGEPVYLHRFQTHYAAVQRYLGQPGSFAFPFSFLNVHMHRPSERSRHFMDALLAFWPGLQVLSGDVLAAVELHEMLYQVQKRHQFLPEAFTPDFGVHWSQYLLRPELIESTYILHRATQDPYYLEVGAHMIETLEKHSRVPCGYAAIKDIRTMEHTDQMDSFVLAETFKYLYLLFADPSDLPVNLDDYVLTTEAHLLPLSLSQLSAGHRPSTNQPIPVADNLEPSVSSPSLPETPHGINSSPHGDRDLRAEQLLHRQARCRSFAFRACHSSPPCDCRSLDSRSCTCSSSPLKKLQVSPTLIACSPSDGPGIPRGLETFRSSFSSSALRCRTSWSRSATWQRFEEMRQPLRLMANRLRSGQTVSSASAESGLRAVDFDSENVAHVQLLSRMGIRLEALTNGNIQLKYDQTLAETPELARSGITFIQDASKLNSQRDPLAFKKPLNVHTVALLHPPFFGRIRFTAGPAHFGRYPGDSPVTPPPETSEEKEPPVVPPTSPQDDRGTSTETLNQSHHPTWRPVIAPIRIAEPFDGCSPLQPLAAVAVLMPSEPEAPKNMSPSVQPDLGLVSGSIIVVERGGCMFIEKAKNLALAGAVGGIAIDNKPGTSAGKNGLFVMSNDESQNTTFEGVNINLPFVFLFSEEGELLLSSMMQNWLATRRPGIGLISKSSDIPHLFAAALTAADQYLDEFQTEVPVSNNTICYLISPRLSMVAVTEVCGDEAPFLISRTLSEEPDIATKVEFPNVTAAALSWQFALTPSMDSDASIDSAFLFTNFNTGTILPKDVHIWLDFVDKWWPASEAAHFCKDLIIAFVEASLVQLVIPGSPSHSNSPVTLSTKWTEILNSCLVNASSVPRAPVSALPRRCSHIPDSSFVQAILHVESSVSMDCRQHSPQS